MGQDILTLRQHLRERESENSKLRLDLTQYNDATKLLMDSQDLDGLTKPQLASRYSKNAMLIIRRFILHEFD